MEKLPWVGERPVDPENCVYEPPNLWVKIAWPVKRKWSMWKATRHVSKRYTDRNHDEIFGLLKEDRRKLLRKMNNDKAMVAMEEIFGLGDIYAKAMQMDRSLCACINNHGHKRIPPTGVQISQSDANGVCLNCPQHSDEGYLGLVLGHPGQRHGDEHHC